jgi:hypothetical protein
MAPEAICDPFSREATYGCHVRETIGRLPRANGDPAARLNCHHRRNLSSPLAPGYAFAAEILREQSGEKNKDVIFLQNEPEKLFRINKTPHKSAKTNRKMAYKVEKTGLIN